METKQEKRFAVVGQGTIFDGIAYWAILIGVYLMVGGLMFYSGKEKLFDDNGNAPQAIKTQFAGTFIDTFPGADAAWVILGSSSSASSSSSSRACSGSSSCRTARNGCCSAVSPWRSLPSPVSRSARRPRTSSRGLPLSTRTSARRW